MQLLIAGAFLQKWRENLHWHCKISRNICNKVETLLEQLQQRLDFAYLEYWARKLGRRGELSFVRQH
jgi:hypothetical protein